jgi:hypothetical protein
MPLRPLCHLIRDDTSNSLPLTKLPLDEPASVCRLCAGYGTPIQMTPPRSENLLTKKHLLVRALSLPYSTLDLTLLTVLMSRLAVHRAETEDGLSPPLLPPPSLTPLLLLLQWLM